MGSNNADAASVRQAFRTQIKPQADAAIKKNKDMWPQLERLVFETDAVIDGKQATTINLFLNASKAQIPKVEACVVELDAILKKIDEFTKANKEFVASLDEVLALNEELTVARRKAAARVLVLKGNQSKAQAALKALEGGRVELTVEWATIEKSARKAHEDILADVKSVYDLRDKARTAAKIRDRKELAALRMKAADTANPYLSEWPAKMKKRLADFAARFEKKQDVKVEKTTLEQLAKDKAELNGILDRIALNAKLLDSLKDEVSRIKPAPPDMARVMKIVGAPTGQADRVKKLLEAGGAALSNGLTAMVKELDLKSSAKDIVAELRKEGFAD